MKNAIFNFVRDFSKDEEEDMPVICGLSREKMRGIVEGVIRAANETLDVCELKGEGIDASAEFTLTCTELGQAGAETISKEELTPEVSFFIGLVAGQEMGNDERHAHYLRERYAREH